MLKRIAYIELDTHAEIAANFRALMEESAVFSVDYYFSEKILKQFPGSHPNIFLANNSTLLDQLSRRSYDLVVIGTAHRNYGLFSNIISKYKTSVIVHNLNFTKISKRQLLASLFRQDFLYRVKLLLKENLLQAPYVFKKAQNLLVLDGRLANDNFKYLPLFFNQFCGKTDPEMLTVVIPGAVSQIRRDYSRVISKVLEFEKKIKEDAGWPKKKLRFIFLGKAESDELKKLTAAARALQVIDIEYFNAKVPQNIFDEWMRKADVLWCPIQSKTEFFSRPEFYGETKMSGCIGDAIKYGKPAVFPKNFSSDNPFAIPEENDLLLQFRKIKDADFELSPDFEKQTVLIALEKVLLSL